MFDPGIFLARPDEIFLIQSEKIEKLRFLGGNFPIPEVADNTSPNPSNKNNLTRPGSKFLTQTHHKPLGSLKLQNLC